MAAISVNELQGVKLKKAPPPKAPIGAAANQHAGIPSGSDGVSVSAFRMKFEQKQNLPPKAHAGSPPRHDVGKRSEENVMRSVSSTRAKFEQKPAKPPPSPWKQTTAVQTNARNSCSQTKDAIHKVEVNRKVFKGEPPLKDLPSFFRIGAAPYKKPKPANLKSLLPKYKDKIVLSNAANSVLHTSTEGKTIWHASANQSMEMPGLSNWS